MVEVRTGPRQRRITISRFVRACCAATFLFCLSSNRSLAQTEQEYYQWCWSQGRIPVGHLATLRCMPRPRQEVARPTPSPEEVETQKNHQDATDLNEQGMTAMNSGKFAAAVRLFRNAQAKWPENSVIQQNLQSANDAANKKIADIARGIPRSLPRRPAPPNVGFASAATGRNTVPDNGLAPCNGGTNQSYEQLKGLGQTFGVDVSRSGNAIYNCKH
jgi:hypothetical protein